MNSVLVGLLVVWLVVIVSFGLYLLLAGVKL